MSPSTCQWMSLRPLGLSFLVMSCFVVLFWTYYKPDFKFPNFDMRLERENDSCPTIVCPEINQTQDSKQNCSSEVQVTQQHNEPQRIPDTPVDTEPDTILLIWMYPFGRKHDLNCDYFNIKKCLLTDDKAMYSKAHGVLFHHRDINPESLPREPRPRFQKWVWSNMESPANSHQIPEINHLFNLTCNYRLDSDIPVPYGYLEPLSPKDQSFKLPAKDKLVCWVVSNWNPNFKRVQVYDELNEYIKIHTYGNAFGKDLSDQDYATTVSSCKFYLSFENSVYKDYITEKLFRPMMLGAVPIVLGPPRETYQNHIPADSFIHVDDFSSVKELAERLSHLDQNDSDYMRYFEWTNGFKAKTSWFGKEQACRTCSYLQSHRAYQSFHDLNKWYWD